VLVEKSVRDELAHLARSVRQLREHFMDPANWETIEKNGYRRCIEIGPHAVILSRRSDGWWRWFAYPNGQLLRRYDGDDTVYEAEHDARLEGWKALAAVI
jgi:hypothetical protein